MENQRELQEMSLERRLATLNITQSRTPVPPPRVKRFQKRMISVPDDMGSSLTNSEITYKDKSYSFDEDTKQRLACLGLDGNIDESQRYDQFPRHTTKQSYHKYEVVRKDNFKESMKHDHSPEVQPMCDIIQSSQQATHRSAQMRRPDILRGSFNADLQLKISETSPNTETAIDSYQYTKSSHNNGRYLHRGKTFDDNKNVIHNGSKSNPDKLVNGRHDSQSISTSSSSSKYNKHGKTPDHKQAPKATSTPNKANSGTNNRFMFYRPKVDKLHKQHNSAIGLVGMAEVNYEGGSLLPSPEGSFVNPAFDIVDNTDKKMLSKSASTAKPVATPSRSIYSTMGSSFSARPCTPSPPSHRFRNQKPPIPSPEPKISPIKSNGPSSLRPMISAKQLETSLKQYPSQSRLDMSDMCSSQALESMLNYYNMTSTSTDSQSDSPTPPPMALSSSKKNQSPFSSTGSLNVSGDSIDVVLRRKKKVRIRPPSFSSDDDVIKRVSLEINLTPSTSQNTPNTSISELHNTNNTELGNNKEFSASQSLSNSPTLLNQPTVEKLDLDDMTSTETAKLLRKQFAKLKVKASNLKVKDTELKQRFAHLQNQRGRVCGHGGSVSKSKLRASPILL